jgi:PLD-like domain
VKAEVEVIILPYSAETGTIGHLLLKELSSGKWQRFQSAVAFARQSGNYQEIVDAIRAFAASGGKVELTFGADAFGTEGRGSDYEAIDMLLSELGENVEVFLYHEKGRTFHPKLYLFSNEETNEARLVVGSSNWSQGGFFSNIEANVVITLDLTQPDHRKCYGGIQTLFADYWKEVE